MKRSRRKSRQLSRADTRRQAKRAARPTAVKTRVMESFTRAVMDPDNALRECPRCGCFEIGPPEIFVGPFVCPNCDD